MMSLLKILNIDKKFAFWFVYLFIEIQTKEHIHMVDYLNAFDESYIPLNVQKGREIMSEELFFLIEDQYQ
jgi:hypothetical protein